MKMVVLKMYVHVRIAGTRVCSEFRHVENHYQEHYGLVEVSTRSPDVLTDMCHYIKDTEDTGFCVFEPLILEDWSNSLRLILRSIFA